MDSVTFSPVKQTFKVIRVIYFGISERQMLDYILLYNNVISEDLEDTMTETTEIRCFRPPTVLYAPRLQITPVNIRANLISPENKIPGYIFPACKGLYSFKST